MIEFGVKNIEKLLVKNFVADRKHRAANVDIKFDESHTKRFQCVGR